MDMDPTEKVNFLKEIAPEASEEMIRGTCYGLAVQA